MDLSQLKRKNNRPVVMQPVQKNIPILTFPELSKLPMIAHAFSTRLGGVSEGYLSSLNFKNGPDDLRSNIIENFRRMGEALDADIDHFVLTQQTHTTNVRIVTEADAGKGLTQTQDYKDVDGLITNVPGLVLSAFAADCVPLYFVDPVNKAIGLAHSGWRGTVGRIGQVVVQKMAETYGTNPSDLIAAIAPSICQDCYEISEDVAEAFQKEFAGHESEILIDKGNGKYQLDLWESNRIVMKEAGIPESQISMTDVCTCCNPDLLFSHRASKGKRGVLGAFLTIK